MAKEVREKKAEIIDELEAAFSKCSSGIITDYRGLSVQEITDLRRKLGKLGIEYKVVKNTLARFAAERLGRSALASSFEGPTAIALGYGEIAEPAKLVTEFISSTKSIMTVKAGFLGDTVLSAAEVASLAKLPPREVIIAQLLGTMQSPIVGLVTCLNAPISGLARVLQARINQMEEA